MRMHTGTHMEYLVKMNMLFVRDFCMFSPLFQIVFHTHILHETMYCWLMHIPLGFVVLLYRISSLMCVPCLFFITEIIILGGAMARWSACVPDTFNFGHYVSNASSSLFKEPIDSDVLWTFFALFFSFCVYFCLSFCNAALQQWNIVKSAI